jgi:hypothetical protein
LVGPGDDAHGLRLGVVANRHPEMNPLSTIIRKKAPEHTMLCSGASERLITNVSHTPYHTCKEARPPRAPPIAAPAELPLQPFLHKRKTV